MTGSANITTGTVIIMTDVEGDFVPVEKTTPFRPPERRVGESLVLAQEGAYDNQD
jgi:hypothetical protein